MTDDHNETQALQPYQPQPLDAYTPNNLTDALTLARNFAGSKLTRVRSPEQALLVMATGAELGMGPAASLRMIYVADFGQGDQAVLSADAMVGVCLKRREICEYFRCTESTDERATYATRRRGDPERTATFTIADKERAKLGEVTAGKDKTATNWAKYPATMLRHRAASMLAREVYPDIIGGFYTEDEYAEIAAAQRPAPVSPLPGGSTPIDAEVVEPAESDETRIVTALDAATTLGEVKSLAAEARKIWPTTRPAAVSAAHKAARERVASATTQALAQGGQAELGVGQRERVPGEEG